MSAQDPAGLPSETPSAPAHEIQRGLAPAGETATPGTPLPRPEMTLDFWTAWVESISKLASDVGVAPAGLPRQVPWQVSPDQFAVGLQRLGEMAGKDSILDPVLRAADGALNANPLREVIPVDWAEIAWALRTVWSSAAARTSTAAESPSRARCRHAMRRSNTAGDCSPRSVVASHASTCMRAHASA